jgi:hypothetical protein
MDWFVDLAKVVDKIEVKDGRLDQCGQQSGRLAGRLNRTAY